MAGFSTHLQNSFTALKHRNYRLFLAGECVSLIGTWMQSIALSWLVLELTNSPFKLGLVAMIQFIPMMLFSLYAGILVDRFRKRNILIITQALLMLLALILGILSQSGLVEYWHLIVLSLILGIVNTIDVPARQSFFIELVGKGDFMNAVALNSGVFNLARIAGPAVGGLLIGLAGIAACFFINAASYVAVIVSLFMIQTLYSPAIRKKPHDFRIIYLGIRQGLRYINRRESIKLPLVLLALVSTFTMNFNIMIPVFAQQNLSQNATGYGFLMTSMALGSLAGSITLATMSKAGPRMKYLLAGSMGMSFFLALMGLETSYVLACITLFIIGFSAMMLMAMINSTIQLNSADHVRGRVTSVYSMVLGGVTPIGAFYAGNIMEFAGAGVCMIISGLIGILATVYAIIRSRRAML